MTFFCLTVSSHSVLQKTKKIALLTRWHRLGNRGKNRNFSLFNALKSIIVPRPLNIFMSNKVFSLF